MNPLAVAAVVVWGGLCAADQRAVAGRQLHQPLVAATVAGALLGDAHGGMWVGLWLQLVWMVLLPVGGAVLPDVGSAAVVAAVLAASLPGPLGAAVALAGALGVARCSIPWERSLRAANARRERRALDGGRLGGVIAHGVAGPALRGALCAAAAVLSAQALRSSPVLASGAGNAPAEWPSILLSGAMVVGMARIGRHVVAEGGRSGWSWLALGAGAGFAARWLLPARSLW